MRISIDVSPVVHGRAGLGRYAHELTTALVAINQDNAYSTFHNGAAAAALPPPLDCLPHASVPLPNKAWRLQVLASHLVRRHQDTLLPGIDLFHATDHLLPNFSHIKSVFTLHDLAFALRSETHTAVNRYFLTAAMPRFLRRADAVIAVSAWTKQDAIRLYRLPEEKITVIYEGVHPRFTLQPPERTAAVRRQFGLPAHFILYVGTIEPRKNLIALLDAFAHLHRQSALDSETKLVVAGKKGWLYQPFFARMRKLGLESQVIFPGFIGDDYLPALYAAADIFAYPSLYEGFGLPVLEAMACGTPVVCSTSSSLPEVAGDAAILVDPADTGALAAALQRVLANPGLHARLAALGLAQARLFTWQEAARQTLAVYQRVMAESRRRPLPAQTTLTPSPDRQA